MKIIHRNEAVHTSHSRDAALRRLRSANRWLIAGSAALTGLLTDVAANAFSGHSKPSGDASAKRHRSTKKLQPPPQAPRPATTAQQTTPQPAPAEPEAPAESPAPAEETPSRAPETNVEAAPAETHEAAPAPEPSEPVVSGGS
jgi:hypothetical protein